MLLQRLRVQVEALVREVGGAGHWGQVCALGFSSGLGTLCLCRYNSLSILPAALGKPVRDVASKVCGGQEHGGSPWSLRYGADLVLFLSF